MAKRLRVVILYSYNENWIGGTYYIQNLILALNKVGDSQKPQLLVVSDSAEEYESLVALTNYPYIARVHLNIQRRIIIRAINKVSRSLFRKNVFSTFFSKFDLLFQTVPLLNPKFNKKALYWIPDFQEHHLPNFFSKEEIDLRRSIQERIVNEGKYILFSSENARCDFNRFYPNNKLKQYVLNFAVTHSDSASQAAFGDLLKKFDLPANYFICCNQFWIHKNHQIILKAVHKLKQEGNPVVMVFTGKEFDHRSPDYTSSLRNICTELGIEQNIRFLGFIGRDEQLCLIRHAQAIVQPSLFEGWSTVIEDAKALNTKIIASNIGVHLEQLETYPQKLYFDPYDMDELAKCMLTNISQSAFDYERSIVSYGHKFVEIVESISRS